MSRIVDRYLHDGKWYDVYEVERTLMGDRAIAELEQAGVELAGMCFDHCSDGEKVWWVTWPQFAVASDGN